MGETASWEKLRLKLTPEGDEPDSPLRIEPDPEGDYIMVDWDAFQGQLTFAAFLAEFSIQAIALLRDVPLDIPERCKQADCECWYCERGALLNSVQLMANVVRPAFKSFEEAADLLHAWRTK